MHYSNRLIASAARSIPRLIVVTASVIVLTTHLSAQPPTDYFQITVVDEATGRGVPLVELKTVNDISHWTDSAGRIAFREPGLEGQTVFFHVASHGYDFPVDGFGQRGVRLNVEAGGKAVVKLKRVNIAERLYRTTGGGVYADSVLLGEKAPVANPILNAKVLGSDTVLNAVFRGKIHWFWGDTNRPSYPLGNFHIPGATSLLPSQGGLDPARGIELKYFVDENGFAAETCHMPGNGPTWIDGLTVLGEGDHQRMFASYVKIKPPLETYARGLVEFNADTNRFEQIAEFALDAPLYPMGHSIEHEVDGKRYIYFPKPFAWVRVVATVDAFRDLKQYEAYTCFTEGSTAQSFELDRNADGKLQWAWRRNTLPMTHDLERRLIARSKLPRSEAVLRLRDMESDKLVAVHSSSIAWNEYRKRWTMIALEEAGTSYLGEIWYAEADQPEGPWSAARKVVTHDNYSFYNPKQHAMLAQEDGKIIYFEGTYTAMFSGNRQHTPRYEYNQIMYRLDLSDSRLSLSESMP